MRETDSVCFPAIDTAGISEIAHADAVIMSMLWVHMIAEGADPCIFNEYNTYAPTLPTYRIWKNQDF